MAINYEGYNRKKRRIDHNSKVIPSMFILYTVHTSFVHALYNRKILGTLLNALINDGVRYMATSIKIWSKSEI